MREIEDKQKQIKTNTQDVLKVWKQHYEEKYNSRNENQQEEMVHTRNDKRKLAANGRNKSKRTGKDNRKDKDRKSQ
ncbi:hypothetical protein ILUMI_04335 [Ignelater luminosus]|uniref:Uncharacterized protein n=1 Tax=Ignelater luminosus TaxID=2038154 RepID=A0A8K0DCS8_IGNLU|nr:hypothetical protein ILUMI_04335 [Ignelater luminosus]